MFEKLIADIKQNKVTTVDLPLEAKNEFITARDIADVLLALRGNKSCTKLSLKNVCFADVDLAVDTRIQWFSLFRTSPMSSLLKSNKTIQEIDMSGTQITQEGLEKMQKLAPKIAIVHTVSEQKENADTLENALLVVETTIHTIQEQIVSAKLELQKANELLAQKDHKINELTRQLEEKSAETTKLASPKGAGELGVFAQTSQPVAVQNEPTVFAPAAQLG